MNKRDLFEQNIKNAVEDFEAPMDLSSWHKIEQKLPVGSSKGVNGIKGWIAGVIVVAVTAVGFWYFSSSSTSEDIDFNKIQKIEKIDNNASGKDILEKSIIIKENESLESVDENKIQDGVEFEQEESKVTSFDLEEKESTDPIPEEEIAGEELINNEPEQPNQEFIEVDEKLMVNWIISKSVLCQGEELMVSINNVNEPVELIWDFCGLLL